VEPLLRGAQGKVWFREHLMPWVHAYLDPVATARRA